ncbi:MAG TPA: hypothetical protein VFI73_01230 [Candidatus Nitrosopolaris sp.]|nr:hypothetical protein [Candidatus Nitrosopolaris sp.]
MTEIVENNIFLCMFFYQLIEIRIRKSAHVAAAKERRQKVWLLHPQPLQSARSLRIVERSSTVVYKAGFKLKQQGIENSVLAGNSSSSAYLTTFGGYGL